jgi:hypothetical protein
MEKIAGFQFNDNEYGELWKLNFTFYLFYWEGKRHPIKDCDYEFSSDSFIDIINELFEWKKWIDGV